MGPKNRRIAMKLMAQRRINQRLVRELNDLRDYYSHSRVTARIQKRHPNMARKIANRLASTARG